MTTEEFEKIVREWIATAKHPKTSRPYTEMVYQPMLELLAYLRANGFKTYIVSGGGVEFMRPWTEKVYGIPPEQVIGSTIKTKFEMRDGKPVLVRCRKSIFIDDGDGKPVAIQKFIGRRPILAFGNSDGDQQMLEWTAAGAGARFMGLVHHTDAAREFATTARRRSAARHGARRSARQVDGRQHEGRLEDDFSEVGFGPCHCTRSTSEARSARRRRRRTPRRSPIARCPSTGCPRPVCRPTSPTRSFTTSCCSTATRAMNLATFCQTWVEPEVHELMDECVDKNMIDKDEYPQTAEIEIRCVHMLADLWHSPDAASTIGCSTTGSSEAAMLGGLALKWRWRERRQAAGKPADRPNLVCGAGADLLAQVRALLRRRAARDARWRATAC